MAAPVPVPVPVPPTAKQSGTLGVTNVRVDLGGGRRYERGDTLAVGHPDASELTKLGVVSSVGSVRTGAVGTGELPSLKAVSPT